MPSITPTLTIEGASPRDIKPASFKRDRARELQHMSKLCAPRMRHELHQRPAVTHLDGCKASTRESNCSPRIAGAGVLLLLEPQAGKPARVVMGIDQKSKLLCDFGGKCEAADGGSSWKTAVRECQEEAGVTPPEAACRGYVVLSNKRVPAGYKLFVVAMRESSLTKLKPSSGIIDWKVVDVNELARRDGAIHSRIRFTNHGSLNEVVDLCRQYGVN